MFFIVLVEFHRILQNQNKALNGYYNFVIFQEITMFSSFFSIAISQIFIYNNENCLIKNYSLYTKKGKFME